MTRVAFEYAVLRAVPRVDRGECINVGVVLYCQAADFLAAAVHLDEARLRLLDAEVDVEAVRAALDGVCLVCRGLGPATATTGAVEAGPAGDPSRRARFGWLTAPRSTVVQAGAVHGGMTADPEADLERLLTALVRTGPHPRQVARRAGH
jgi:Protein of unknown function (DUF3037)